MRKFGLIGFPLSHSFSKKYFENKFRQDQILDSSYDLYELKKIEELPELIQQEPSLKGFNVTIPYKTAIIPYLSSLGSSAQTVGAVNVVKVNEDGSLIGYNSDYYGFLQSLVTLISRNKHPNSMKGLKALVLGTGGAAQAVMAALKALEIPFQMVSRSKKHPKSLLYENINSETIARHRLIVNTTPLGMYPKVEGCPALPYESLTSEHLLYDLVYNPEETAFLKKGASMGAQCKGGLEMLYLQADRAWDIWHDLAEKG